VQGIVQPGVVIPTLTSTPYNPGVDEDSNDAPPQQPREGKKCFGLKPGIPSEWTCCNWTAWVVLMLAILTGMAIMLYIGINNLVIFFSTSFPIISVDQEASGFIAIGQSAIGFIAIGQFAVGFVTIGQLTFGFINLSMLGVGIIGSVAIVGGSLGPTIGVLTVGSYIHACIVGVGLFYVKKGFLCFNAIAPFFHDNDDRKIFFSKCK